MTTASTSERAPRHWPDASCAATLTPPRVPRRRGRVQRRGAGAPASGAVARGVLDAASSSRRTGAGGAAAAARRRRRRHAARRRSPASPTRSTRRRRRSTPAPRSTTTSSASSIDIDENNEFYGVLATKWNQTDDDDLGVRPRRQRHVPQRRAVHPGRRRVHVRADPRPDDGERLRAAVRRDRHRSRRPSPTQVTFHLKTPFGPFLTNLANNGEIVNQKAIESGDPARNPVGTGPVQVRRMGAGRPRHAREERRLLHGRPAVPRRRRVPVPARRPEPHRRRCAAGELDWVDAVPLQQLPALSSGPALHLRHLADGRHPRLPGDEHDQARRSTTRRCARPSPGRSTGTQIRDVAYFGAGEIGSEEVPTGSPWFDGADVYAGGPDVEKAKALLAEAGHHRRR